MKYQTKQNIKGIGLLSAFALLAFLSSFIPDLIFSHITSAFLLFPVCLVAVIVVAAALLFLIKLGENV